MSKAQPKSHPWQQPLTLRQSASRRHSAAFASQIIAALAQATVTEVAAASGLTRGAVTGIIATARRAGTQVVFKTSREPAAIGTIERTAHVHVPAPKRVRTKPVTLAKPSKPAAPAPDRRTTFGTGVSVLDVRVGQCRALDDRRECCCQPVVPGSSWCAGHRALYVTGTRRAA